MENQETPQEWQPKPAESFQVEFGSAKLMEVTNTMSKLGFLFRRGIPENDEKVTFEGERSDGTKILITFEKGENYKSPKELADQVKVREEELNN